MAALPVLATGPPLAWAAACLGPSSCMAELSSATLAGEGEDCNALGNLGRLMSAVDGFCAAEPFCCCCCCACEAAAAWLSASELDDRRLKFAASCASWLASLRIDRNMITYKCVKFHANQCVVPSSSMQYLSSIGDGSSSIAAARHAMDVAYAST